MNKVNISCLGNYGRFGNQLFQYAFASAYAFECSAELYTPPWVGQTIFKNIKNKTITEHLPKTLEDVVPLPPEPQVDLVGYFQGPTHLDFYNEEFAKSIFQINDNIINILEKMVPKKPYLACHLRRGDYVEKYSNVFCIVKEDAYIQKIKEIGWDAKDVVWITEGSSFKNPELPDELQFLQDFYILMKADVLLRANSSFSWWAGTLSTDQIIFSPLVQDKVGWQTVPFVRGNYAATIWQPPHHMELRLKQG